MVPPSHVTSWEVRNTLREWWAGDQAKGKDWLLLSEVVPLGCSWLFSWLSRSVDKYNSVWFTSVYAHTTHIKLISFGWVPYIFTKAFLVTSWRIASIMTYDCKEEDLVWNDQPLSYLKRFWEARSSEVLDPFFYYARLVSVEAMPQSPGRDSSESLWEV